VIAPVSAQGKVCFYVYGKAHLLADVSGYFTDGFTALPAPTRLLNTRDSGIKVGSLDGMGASYELPVSGWPGLPTAGALLAVAMNVTVVDGEAGNAGGFVTVYPCGTRPNASNLNFVNGQTVPNAVIAPVSAQGKVCFYVYGKAHLLADVSGYFDRSLTSLDAPTRLLNTRDSGVKVGSLSGNGEPYELAVTGSGGLPSSGVSVLAMNVTVVDGEAGNAGGFVTVYPCGTRPNASNLNFVNGQTVPNAVIAPVSATGKVCLYVYGKAHLLVDVSGYFGAALPVPTTNYGLASVLSTQQAKWTDFQALQSSPTVQSMSLNNRLVPMVAGSMTFRTTNVVGLALPDAVSPGTSGLLAVSAAGIATDALTSGTATISKFFTAPNGKYYVLFNGTAELVPGGPQCLLAEVEQSTGIPTCIDGTMSSITWSSAGNFRNPPIQFDDSGSVYYQGTTNSGSTVLRKWSSGSGVDLINQNIYINDFLVLGDGTTILSGTTISSNLSWVRKIAVGGGITTLANINAHSISKFVDGNVYIGLWGGTTFGVKRYLTQSGQLDSKYWISGNTNGIDRETYFNAETLCANEERSIMAGFCGNYGTNLIGAFSVLGQKNFVIAGWYGQSGTVLMQFYPTVERSNSIVNSVSIAQQYLTTIVMAGTDANGTNLLTLYDTGSKQETILVDQSNEIEIYNMTYVSATNKIMFNGLRFSDNRQVVGEIDLS
jgi:hypothetical protein